MKYFLLIVSSVMLCGCNQWMARNAGGTASIDLPQGEKLITVTWKDSHLWYLTRPMRSDEAAEAYSFKESSNFGIVNGTVVIKERK